MQKKCNWSVLVMELDLSYINTTDVWFKSDADKQLISFDWQSTFTLGVFLFNCRSIQEL